MVILELLLEERDGGGAVEDDPRLRGGALVARLQVLAAPDGGNG